MERFVLNKLLEWKNSPYRKPLILKGVRQVGKTWILKEFGKRYYENTAYFNFDENEEYRQFFETTKDVNRILQNLILASGQKIEPEKTLIIFDEVQELFRSKGESDSISKECLSCLNKLVISRFKNKNRVECELEYITTIRQNYTQRIANFAFSHPVRVGIDFVKKS